MHIQIPKLSLVVLIGTSGAGKTTFARKHFLPSEVLSSDYCRGLVSDDENSVEATGDAFDVLHFIAARRLARGKLTVVDATNVQPEARRPLVELARKHHCLPVAVVLNLPEALCHDRIHTHQNHAWHMQTLTKVCQCDPGLLLATPYHVINVTDPDSEQAGTDWWTSLTARGGEGMVVKPLEFIVKGKKGLVQPAVKCRGREYLRIIYGPDYDSPENLPRLRSRHLRGKRSLAIREFALGIEGLERFVRKEPLRRVHECVFGVLALESEPVDPRL